MFYGTLAENGMHHYRRLPCVQEAQLSPRDSPDALYQLKCCPIVVPITQQITQTGGVLARAALPATATSIVLYKHHCNRHSNRNCM